MSCNSQSYDFPCHTTGDTFDGVQFTCTLNSAPINLTGALIVMNIYIKTKPNILTLASSINGGITILAAVNGVFQIDPQIINIPANKYDYEIKINFADATVKTYIEGTWTISL